MIHSKLKEPALKNIGYESYLSVNQNLKLVYSSLYYPITLEGCRGTDGFATILSILSCFQLP